MSHGFTPRFNPLILTVLGRTGSTFVMGLFRHHPQIAVQPAYPYEVRAAGYWLQLLRVLIRPGDEMRLAEWSTGMNQSWFGSSHPYDASPITDDARVAAWFIDSYPRSLMAFLAECIDDFYERIAETQDKLDALYFAEKWGIGYRQWMCWETHPQMREVILVRDPCDVVSSIQAFNAKRGFLDFGRQHAQSDEDFVRRLRADFMHLLSCYKQRSERAQLLRYEDLIREPAATMRQVLASADLDNTDKVIKSMFERTSSSSGQFRRHQTSREAISSIGRWRHDLKPDLRRICEEEFEEVRTLFGYSP